MAASTVRDKTLLDALEAMPQDPLEARVWRSVKMGHDPLICWASGGRWDDGGFDVLYTSFDRHTAIEERRFHLFKGQPFPPSKIRFELFELEVSLSSVITFETRADLVTLGTGFERFGQLSYAQKDAEYPTSQQIAEACFFLGADGINVPSARSESGRNLVIFCDQHPRPKTGVRAEHGEIDF